MARVVRHYVSKLFQPQHIVPKNLEVKYDHISRSQKLMLDLGIIRSANNGFFYILPLGERSLRKLEKIVDEEMEKIGAQKMLLPSLVASHLWKTSGRLDDAAVTCELFTLKDRHDKSFVLGPTHEEAVTDLLSSVANISYRHLPLQLYQITNKFRDEKKTRFGLLRSKEFLMKDLYSFDADLESSKKTYETVTAAYRTIFNRIGVKYVRVVGLTGIIGGSVSHEFHFPSEVGEDSLIMCKSCGCGNNADAFPHLVHNIEKVGSEKCCSCGQQSLSQVQGIEVGHTFLLGTKYTQPLKAQFMQQNGKPAFLEMGCYGLGISRILAAVVECLCQSAEIRWPFTLAPFKVCIIPPKGGSKESTASGLVDALCHQLDAVPLFADDVIVDDRLNLTIGKRLRDAARVGYPLVVVCGKQATEPQPLLEIHNLSSSQQVLLPVSETVHYLVQQTKLNLKSVVWESPIPVEAVTPG